MQLHVSFILLGLLLRFSAAEVQTTPNSKSSTLASRAEEWTHSIAHDLRVAFGGILLSPSTRKAYHRRQSNLIKNRKRDGSQSILSSEYCLIAAKSSNGTNAGSQGSGTSTGSGGGGSHGTAPASYNPSSTPTLVSGAPAPSATATSPASNWGLAESHEGVNFFDGWDFFEGADPTHGMLSVSLW